ncbi:MAG: glycosyltransferase, partial [Anaerolineales bacterium]|nr:glycosyltransferase [Anaerolineales bacterium]
MNILYVSPYPPILIRARTHNIIRHLRRKGHALTLATVWQGHQEAQALEELRASGMPVIAAPLRRVQVARNVLGAVASGLPIQARYCWQPALVHATLQALRAAPGFDVVHSEHMRGAEHALSLRAAAAKLSRRPVFVWDSVDCITMLFEQAARQSRNWISRLITRWELPSTRRYEKRVARQFDRVLVVSERDQAALERVAGYQAGESPIRVVPNGVDTEYFTPNFGPRQPATIIFTGKMSYHANATAAAYLVEQIMPLVWAQWPEAQVIIAGSSPTRAVVALGQSQAPRVQVTGYVPDLRPYLQSATVAVAPITYGAGMQNKVVEAMACGTPVIASPRAVSALNAQVGEEVLVAEAPAEFAQALLRLLKDEAL